ncbi:hypothetical protein CBS101457_000278 [Exobasidium rhododendri]|nr:hypothetical protein CBS101457_000278 [Exobasidium rhododendri]
MPMFPSYSDPFSLYTEDGSLASVVYGNQNGASSSSFQPRTSRSSQQQEDRRKVPSSSLTVVPSRRTYKKTPQTRDLPRDVPDGTTDYFAHFSRPSKEEIYRKRRQRTQHALAQIDTSSLVWQDRGYEEHDEFMEIVNRRRGIRCDTAKRVLKVKLTAELEKGLLSGVTSVVDAAIAEMFPISGRTLLPIWMLHMREVDSDRLVQRMANISGRSKEIVRNHFLRQEMTSDTAYALLSASDDDILRQYAVDSGLQLPIDLPREKAGQSVAKHPWQWNLSPQERSRVRDLVVNACKRCESWAYEWLKAPHVWRGFGRALLDSSGHEFSSLINYLQKGRYLEDGEQ